MGGARGMRVGEGAKDAPENLDRAAQRQLAVAHEPGAQGRARDERPGVVDERARAAGAARGYEPGMSQPVAEQ